MTENESYPRLPSHEERVAERDRLHKQYKDTASHLLDTEPRHHDSDTTTIPSYKTITERYPIATY